MSRRTQGGLSRRNLIAGGFITAGSALLVIDSDAFSKAIATRGTSLDIGSDDDALLGIDIVPFVKVGTESELVTVSNNTDSGLSISVSLSDSSDGSVSEPNTKSVASGNSTSFSAFISTDADAGIDALPFKITATNEGQLQIDATRRTTIPSLTRSIIDETQNSNAAFTVQYKAHHVPDFDRIEIEIENIDGRDLSDSYTEYSSEGSISYPSDRGSDGGAAGDTYEFRFEVFDSTHGSVIKRIVTKDANGKDDGDGNFRDEDDPILEMFDISDNSILSEDQVKFIVNYELSNTGTLGQVNVTFDNQANSWSDQTTTTESEPTGEVTYPEGGGTQGGTTNQEYKITVEVTNESGIPVDSGSVTTVADGTDPEPYTRDG